MEIHLVCLIQRLKANSYPLVLQVTSWKKNCYDTHLKHAQNEKNANKNGIHEQAFSTGIY